MIVDLGNWPYLVHLFIMFAFFSLLKVGIFSSKTLPSDHLYIFTPCRQSNNIQEINLIFSPAAE